ncbi:group-specific protein [Terrihalobacillus insolitus]|uniref:group-specific protein n=1 Tax=Terrihalobacillus insolitus TaxID=2950438 RepID=UPI00233F98DB|nr:group-specific protein [Terrihalobacillus insolitus]MDC3414304.1 group-specific protein [Terrihalobacillus insolitus]
MLQIQVDEEVIKELYQKAIDERLKELDQELVYWDTKELKRRTCMSWNTILNTFFWEDDFPKVKIGGKWYFPADEAKRFLNQWLANKK